MLVKDGMSTPAITIKPTATLGQCAATLAREKIHQLPVVGSGGKLVGIITDRDLRDARARPDFDACPVEEVMTGQVVCVHPNDTLEDALLLLQRQRFGAMPVVDEAGKVVGIFTRYDCLRLLVDVLGISEVGSRLELQIDNPQEQLGKAMGAMAQHDVLVISAVLTPDYRRRGRRLYIRLRTIDPSPIEQSMTEVGLRIIKPGK